MYFTSRLVGTTSWRWNSYAWIRFLPTIEPDGSLVCGFDAFNDLAKEFEYGILKPIKKE
jgi:hypothetical protein